MEKKEFSFDFTPDPRVLIALTQTPIVPLDAICELIDNSIDSFTNAQLQGTIVDNPTIWIDLPSKKDIDKQIGILRIRDNGPGMTTEQAEKAIKAGYSGNNAIDTLGLFGMGFNISTGKIGVVTKFTTARKEDDYCTQTVIDLDKISKSRSYALTATQQEKPMALEMGTLIEIHHWWPEGHPNHGFVKKLVHYGVQRIRTELGRIYATILRNNKIRILVDKEPCVPFEHCVWGSNRYVERKGSQIFARYDVDKILGTKRRCVKCRTIVPDGDNVCPSCESTEIRSVEDRVKGWIGIQRFDDAVNYGIDLIRNGRAIKRSEKNAFFEFVDEFKNVTKDYPIDSQYGRIVGEVHLDFVPVDFLKQDFQRSSDEWQRAMSFLRGDSSLQPTKPGADKNESIIYKLYQGYRKVRTPGRTDMYIGYWDKNESAPKRFPNREKEKEYYNRFLAKEKGFYDDEEWWKLVEEASQPPVEPLVICECGFQNLKESETCLGCGKILIGKKCVNEACGKEIPYSVERCPYCETSQIPEITVPWVCDICGTKNGPEISECKKCKSLKGKKNPLSQEVLVDESKKIDDLSISDFSIKLADGTLSSLFNLKTYYSEDILTSLLSSKRVPIVLFKNVSEITMVVDRTHPVFSTCGLSIFEVVASELAAYIFDLNRNLIKYPEHSIANIMWEILNKYWKDQVEISVSTIETRCNQLMNTIKEQLCASLSQSKGSEIFAELSDDQQRVFLNNLLNDNKKITDINQLKESGEFVRYVPNDFLLRIYESYPEMFFNGKIWKDPYGIKVSDLSTIALYDSYNITFQTYKNNLEAIIIFLKKEPSKDMLSLKRIDSTLNLLSQNLNDDLK